MYAKTVVNCPLIAELPHINFYPKDLYTYVKL